MYEAYYSLEYPPFVLTPDPRFLLRSKGHHEILGALLYGITSQKGLMALVGDVGTGKTTLCRALLRDLPDNVQSALLLNPHLSDVDLIATLLDDLGVERRGSTKGELMATLSQHLLATGSEGKTVLVIVDEAQQMSVECLEQVRILSRSEERRVGKECRSRWWQYHQKKKSSSTSKTNFIVHMPRPIYVNRDGYNFL